jgi:hypothetical protein
VTYVGSAILAKLASPDVARLSEPEFRKFFPEKPVNNANPVTFSVGIADAGLFHVKKSVIKQKATRSPSESMLDWEEVCTSSQSAPLYARLRRAALLSP